MPDPHDDETTVIETVDSEPDSPGDEDTRRMSSDSRLWQTLGRIESMLVAHIEYTKERHDQDDARLDKIETQINGDGNGQVGMRNTLAGLVDVDDGRRKFRWKMFWTFASIGAFALCIFVWKLVSFLISEGVFE